MHIFYQPYKSSTVDIKHVFNFFSQLFLKIKKIIKSYDVIL